MHDVKLTVAGRDFGGWQSLRVTRGIEQIAGTFELGVSQLWPVVKGSQDLTRNIDPGAECALAVDGETVITGFVDEVKPGYDANSHSVSVSGRDATGDLVDCSVAYRTWGMGVKMEQVVADVIKPFPKIKLLVAVDTGGGLPLGWSANESESVFECIERLARERGVLLFSDGQGHLSIMRAGRARVGTALVRGVNILAAALSFNHRDRFHTYIVSGSLAARDPASAGIQFLKGLSIDKEIRKERTKWLLHQVSTDGNGMQRRADWERNVRVGRSLDLKVKVQGWAHADGLWQPNTVVRVTDPDFMRLDEDLLIKRVTFTLDGLGSVTELDLTLPDAFALIPFPSLASNWDALKAAGGK